MPIYVCVCACVLVFLSEYVWYMHICSLHVCERRVHLPMNMSKRPEEDGFLALSSPFYSLEILNPESTVFVDRLPSKSQ